MKFFYLVFLILIASAGFAQDGVLLKYGYTPYSIECNFKYDVKVENKTGVTYRPSYVNVKTSSSKMVKKDFVLDLDIENINPDNNLNRKNTYNFSYDEGNNKIVVGNSSKMSLFYLTDASDNVLTSQLIFPSKKVRVGDVWYTTISNPLENKSLLIENRLIRVTNENIAVIVFEVKNPFTNNDLVTDLDLLNTKIKEGSTFDFRFNGFSGPAEIVGSGIWFFDIDKGMIKSSTQYYKIVSLMRSSKEISLENLEDFNYMDIFAQLNYKFILE